MSGAKVILLIRRHKMSPVQAAFIYLLLTTTKLLVTAEETTDTHRLPKFFTPHSYEIALVIPPESFTDTSNEFSGKVTAHFAFVTTKDYIVINAHHETITIKSVMFNNVEIPKKNYAIDNDTNIMKIQIGYNVTLGISYELAIEYKGLISTKDLVGLYRVKYKTRDGVTLYSVASQFSTVFARKAFPCFDEPSLKATFEVTVTFPEYMNVLFNTPEKRRMTNDVTGLTTVTFKKTPQMSTFILGLVVSELTCTGITNTSTVPIQVCSRDEYAFSREVALDVTPKILARLDNFTNYPCSRHMDKLDHVAMPQFHHVAMENWGLITYRESALLWDKTEANDAARQYIVIASSHEMAHLWFGDLVTFKWFSEVFLQEGLAAYLAYVVAHEVMPAWEYDKRFIIDEMRLGLAYDVENNFALQTPTAVSDISNRYSHVTYKKGGSIMRMVQHIMGYENFREGIRNYLKQYELSSTNPEELWATLNEKIVERVSRLPSSLGTVMTTWVQENGFPLLTVNRTGNRVTISQKKFLYTGTPDALNWYVPITFTTSVDFNKFQSTTPTFWLTPHEDLHFTVPNKSDWIILNNQITGFYRVNYDRVLWQKIKVALLRGNYDGITEIQRAQLVDDLFNLARAQQMKYSTVLDILRFLRYDESYYTWQTAMDSLSGFKFLVARVGDYTELGQAIMNDALELMTGVYMSVPFSTIKDDDQTYTMKQMFIFDSLCKFGQEECINTSQLEFKKYRLTGKRPHRNFRTTIYCTAMRNSTDSYDWYFLWDAYIAAADIPAESDNIRKALGCSRNTTLLKEYLTKTITDGSGFRDDNPQQAILAVSEGTPEGVDVVFEFLTENHKLIEEKYPSFDFPTTLFNSVGYRVSNQKQFDRLKTLLVGTTLTDRFKHSAFSTFMSADKNIKWVADVQKELAAYYNITLPRTRSWGIIFFIYLGSLLLTGLIIGTLYFAFRYRRAIRVVAENACCK